MHPDDKAMASILGGVFLMLIIVMFALIIIANVVG